MFLRFKWKVTRTESELSKCVRIGPRNRLLTVATFLPLCVSRGGAEPTVRTCEFLQFNSQDSEEPKRANAFRVWRICESSYKSKRISSYKYRKCIWKWFETENYWKFPRCRTNLWKYKLQGGHWKTEEFEECCFSRIISRKFINYISK